MAIKYENMNAEQKARAEAWADRWGVPVEACPMSNSGRIVTSIKPMLKYMSEEDYDIVVKDHIKRSEITEAYRIERRQKLKEDLEGLPKVKGLRNR